MGELVGNYSTPLVLLSIIIAIMASYSSFDLARRVASSHGKANKAWLFAGSLILGLGIWSMHFVGMLAFKLPIPVSYNVYIVFISMITPMLGAFLTLYLLSRTKVSMKTLFLGAVLIGLSIVFMHYTGMAAMDMQAKLTYDPLRVLLSIVIAIVASYISLLIGFLYKKDSHPFYIKMASGMVLGFAIVGMHYTGMSAVSFTHHELPVSHLGRLLDHSILAFAIGIATLIMIGFVVQSVYLDRQLLIRQRHLEEKEQHYKSLYDHHPDAVYSFDLAGNFIDVNHVTEKFSGYKAKELLNMSFHQLIAPEYLELTQNKFDLTVKGQPQNYNITALNKSGQRFDVNVTNIPIIVGNRIIGVYGIAKDITELNMQEEKLRQSEERYRSLIENTLDTIAVIDSEKWLFMNPAGLEMFRAGDYHQILGRPINQFLRQGNYQTFQTKVKEIIEKQISLEPLEEIWYRVDGTQIHTEVLANPTNYNGQAAVQLIIRDITVKKQAEELLIKSEKLSIAGQLAAGIAHEIRNPLTSLKGFLQLMRSGAEGKELYFEIMQEELDRIELILSELLILAKPQAIQFGRHGITSILQNVITLLDTQAIMNSVQIVADFEAEQYIDCNENQLKQVFINFIKNGIEAMPHGGKLLIETKKIESDILVRITDEGCGIPEEKIAKLGQPFYTTKEKGTGLGMMVSFKIIETHRGNISVSSKLDEGTVFEIRIPISQETSRERAG